MTRLTSMIAMFVVVSGCYATGPAAAEQTEPAGAQQTQAAPRMPEGHPPLPADHPDMTQAQTPAPQGQMPQGHPPVAIPEPKVYETTDIEPDWHVAVRHLIIRPSNGQLYVTEVWTVVNPTDKTYIGKPVPGAAQQEATDSPDVSDPHTKGGDTLAIPLPPAASHIQPGRGFDACCTRLEDGKLISKSPMQPGKKQFQINYLLAPMDGMFDLPIHAISPIKHMMIFVPDDGSHVTFTGLEEGAPFVAGKKRYRIYMAKQVEKGAVSGLKIEAKEQPVSAASMPPGTGAPPADNSDQIKKIAGIAGAVLVLGALIVMLKPSRKQPAATASGQPQGE